MKVAEELLARFGFSDFYYELNKKLEEAEKLGKCDCPEDTFGSEPCAYDKMGEPIAFRDIDLSCSFCQAARRRWFKRQDAKEREDFEFLFQHLKKHVKKWWD